MKISDSVRQQVYTRLRDELRSVDGAHGYDVDQDVRLLEQAAYEEALDEPATYCIQCSQRAIDLRNTYRNYGESIKASPEPSDQGSCRADNVNPAAAEGPSVAGAEVAGTGAGQAAAPATSHISRSPGDMQLEVAGTAAALPRMLIVERLPPGALGTALAQSDPNEATSMLEWEPLPLQLQPPFQFLAQPRPTAVPMAGSLSVQPMPLQKQRAWGPAVTASRFQTMAQQTPLQQQQPQGMLWHHAPQAVLDPEADPLQTGGAPANVGSLGDRSGLLVDALATGAARQHVADGPMAAVGHNPAPYLLPVPNIVHQAQPAELNPLQAGEVELAEWMRHPTQQAVQQSAASERPVLATQPVPWYPSSTPDMFPTAAPFSQLVPGGMGPPGAADVFSIAGETMSDGPASLQMAEVLAPGGQLVACTGELLPDQVMLDATRPDISIGLEQQRYRQALPTDERALVSAHTTEPAQGLLPAQDSQGQGLSGSLLPQLQTAQRGPRRGPWHVAQRAPATGQQYWQTKDIQGAQTRSLERQASAPAWTQPVPALAPAQGQNATAARASGLDVLSSQRDGLVRGYQQQRQQPAQRQQLSGPHQIQSQLEAQPVQADRVAGPWFASTPVPVSQRTAPMDASSRQPVSGLPVSASGPGMVPWLSGFGQAAGATDSKDIGWAYSFGNVSGLMVPPEGCQPASSMSQSMGPMSSLLVSDPQRQQLLSSSVTAMVRPLHGFGQRSDPQVMYPSRAPNVPTLITALTASGHQMTSQPSRESPFASPQLQQQQPPPSQRLSPGARQTRQVEAPWQGQWAQDHNRPPPPVAFGQDSGGQALASMGRAGTVWQPSNFAVSVEPVEMDERGQVRPMRSAAPWLPAAQGPQQGTAGLVQQHSGPAHPLGWQQPGYSQPPGQASSAGQFELPTSSYGQYRSASAGLSAALPQGPAVHDPRSGPRVPNMLQLLDGSQRQMRLEQPRSGLAPRLGSSTLSGWALLQPGPSFNPGPATWGAGQRPSLGVALAGVSELHPAFGPAIQQWDGAIPFQGSGDRQQGVKRSSSAGDGVTRVAQRARSGVLFSSPVLSSSPVLHPGSGEPLSRVSGRQPQARPGRMSQMGMNVQLCVPLQQSQSQQLPSQLS